MEKGKGKRQRMRGEYTCQNKGCDVYCTLLSKVINLFINHAISFGRYELKKWNFLADGAT